MAIKHIRSTLFGILLLQQQLTKAHTVDLQPYEKLTTGRERISLNDDWRFWRSEKNPDGITYDNRTDTPQGNVTYLRPWILPNANEFIPDESKHYQIPSSAPNVSIPYVASTFDDGAWEAVTLPHDWAIKGPFYVGYPTAITGGMGRLPTQGVGWYRRKISVSAADKGKITYLDIDGAMSYAIVWLNGKLVGGWPYGYNSFRLDLTPYLKSGDDNQLSIRLDNPVDSSRWYPGAGIYRNVWLTKVDPTHIAHWGTYVTTKDVSAESATIDITVQVESKSNATERFAVVTDLHIYDPKTKEIGEKVAQFPQTILNPTTGKKQTVNASITITNPRLWGPPPLQKPNMYTAVTRLATGGNTTTYDTYETPFGVRSFAYSGDQGLSVNGERLRIQGVNQHCHDLGALGSAWNARAAERQLEVLRDLGVNAIRMAHNPPALELLDLCDRMGFIVMVRSLSKNLLYLSVNMHM